MPNCKQTVKTTVYLYHNRNPHRNVNAWLKCCCSLLYSFSGEAKVVEVGVASEKDYETLDASASFKSEVWRHFGPREEKKWRTDRKQHEDTAVLASYFWLLFSKYWKVQILIVV